MTKKYDTIDAWGKNLRNALMSDFPEDSFVKFCLDLEAEVYNRALNDLAETVKATKGNIKIDELVSAMNLSHQFEEDTPSNRPDFSGNILKFERPRR